MAEMVATVMEMATEVPVMEMATADQALATEVPVPEAAVQAAREEPAEVVREADLVVVLEMAEAEMAEAEMTNAVSCRRPPASPRLS